VRWEKNKRPGQEKSELTDEKQQVREREAKGNKKKEKGKGGKKRILTTRPRCFFPMSVTTTTKTERKDKDATTVTEQKSTPGGGGNARKNRRRKVRAGQSHGGGAGGGGNFGNIVVRRQFTILVSDRKLSRLHRKLAKAGVNIDGALRLRLPTNNNNATKNGRSSRRQIVKLLPNNASLTRRVLRRLRITCEETVVMNVPLSAHRNSGDLARIQRLFAQRNLEVLAFYLLANGGGIYEVLDIHRAFHILELAGEPASPSSSDTDASTAAHHRSATITKTWERSSSSSSSSSSTSSSS
jgi:hypothetical protein